MADPINGSDYGILNLDSPTRVPSLFSFYIADMPRPTYPVKRVCYADVDPGMSLNCAPTRVCRKSTSRPGYVVKVRPDPGYVVKQCPRIVMNKIFDWH